MRLWPRPYLDSVAKLVAHVSAQNEAIRALEADLHSFKQQAFMEEKRGIAVARELPHKPVVKHEKWPLAKRLADILDRNAQSEWLSTLKWNGLSEDEAKNLANHWRQNPY